MKNTMKIFRLIALCALIACLAGCAVVDSVLDDCEATDVEDFRRNCGYYEKDDNYSLYTYIVNQFDELMHGDTSIVSSLSFTSGVYTYIDSSGESEVLVDVPLSNELVSWWTDYGHDDPTDKLWDNAYYRPMPEIEFDGTKFDMVTVAVPANATQEELAQVAEEDIRDVNLDIVYEFLMRTYGIPKDKVATTFIEDTCKIIHSDLINGPLPVRVVYLWFATTDGTVSKLDAELEDYFLADGYENCYIVVYEKSGSVGPSNYTWHIPNDEA